ncbi:MAG: NAD(P)/FAD-dependent oxidoreductase, partial [Bacilli bacterium]|nr:NAD(P)/FAD-dependent oxidoreductase [Bacilli bacterium]
IKINNKHFYSKQEIETIVTNLKDFKFTFNESYSFADSQVTVGGLSLDQINSQFASKKENNVYFIGELLNIDGLCGGYNLMFSIKSSLEVAKNF